jgi:hypothetical protein
MTRVGNQFVDPAGRVPTYVWPINHNEESQITKSRQMVDGAPTSNIGLIPQEGSPAPLIFEWKGTILVEAQLTAMLQWWALCETQTIHVVDFAGDAYEVLITDFLPIRVALGANPRQANMPWKWTYTLTMRVLTVFSGPWQVVAP